MKPILFTITLILISTGSLLAQQQFVKTFSIDLPDTIKYAHAQWADIDNNGLLDNVLFVKNSDNEDFMMFIPGDTVNTPILSPLAIILPAYTHSVIYDYDADNQLDIVYSTLTTTGWLKNTGDFTFEDFPLTLPPFSGLVFADVTDDGRSECLLYGENPSGFYMHTFERSATEVWKPLHDSLQINVHDLQILDVDKDGFNDIFLSARESADSTFSAVFLKRNNGFTLGGKINALTKAIHMDLDTDADPEIIAWTDGSLGNSEKYVIQYEHSDTVLFEKTEDVNKIFNLWYADFNSDGLIDEAFYGKISEADTINTIRYEEGVSEDIPFKIETQAFGDRDYDGDLDLVQITHEDHLKVDLYENTTTQKNQHPAGPRHGLAFKIYNWLFMYWEKSVDDHTSSHAITYDVHLEGSSVYLNGSFDLVNENRLTVSQGNNGTLNYTFLKNFNDTNINYSIQAVDNSLHAGKGGTCTGSGVGCINLTEQNLALCSGEIRTLTGPENAQWFSVQDGYLGMGPTYDYHASTRDTIFYFTPDFENCPTVKIFKISIDNTVVKKFEQDIYGCHGQEVLLTSFSYSSSWTSKNSGDLGSGNSITYKIEGSDTIMATFQNTHGCNMQKEFSIFMSVPQVTVTPPEAVILKGNSIQLLADGAQRFVWTPADNLSNPAVANPIASPADDIQYTVTGYDSLGCEANAKVFIRVETNGFAPSLFTPNADGKNDEFKIYGVQDIRFFRFVVTDRTGIVVYEANNADHVINQGWDGRTNGITQPSGVYFWRVEGTLTSGEALLLNGKKEGSILLLR